MTKLLDNPTLAPFMADVDEMGVPAPHAGRRHGAATGTLMGFTNAGDAVIRVATHGKSLVARSTATLTMRDVGHDVALVFEDGDPDRPIVLGVLQTVARVPERNVNSTSLPFELEIDREKIELRAKQEIVLRCGSASVTLKRDGRIIVRGTDILSRSTGLNRIKGGVVQIN